MAEIWTGSHPQNHPPPPILIIWWLAWVISNFVGATTWSIPSDSNDTDINQLILLSSSDLVSDVILIQAALLLIWTVWRITSNQIEKHDACWKGNISRLSYSIHALGNMMGQSVRDFLILLGYMAVATMIMLNACALALAAFMAVISE